MKAFIALIVNYAWVAFIVWVALIVLGTVDMIRFVRNNGWGDTYLYSSKTTPSEKRFAAWLAGFGLTLFIAGMIKAFAFEEKGYAPLLLFSPLALVAVYVIVDYCLNKENQW